MRGAPDSTGIGRTMCFHVLMMMWLVMNVLFFTRTEYTNPVPFFAIWAVFASNPVIFAIAGWLAGRRYTWARGGIYYAVLNILSWHLGPPLWAAFGDHSAMFWRLYPQILWVYMLRFYLTWWFGVSYVGGCLALWGAAWYAGRKRRRLVEVTRDTVIREDQEQSGEGNGGSLRLPPRGI